MSQNSDRVAAPTPAEGDDKVKDRLEEQREALLCRRTRVLNRLFDETELARSATTEIRDRQPAAVTDAGAPQEGAEHEQRCGGTGMVAYWDGSAYAGEMCRGCIDCERHDSECEAELTSHGYTPCRCDERAKSRVAAPTPETPESAERTLRSIAAMLGWDNTPPRETLEREIAALKARALAGAVSHPQPEVKER